MTSKSGQLHAIRDVIFDLDGTLLDTAPDILASLVAAYAAAGLGETIQSQLPTSLIGPPLGSIIRALTPNLDEAQQATVLAEFCKTYDASNYLLTRTFPGVRETLAWLDERSYRIFVATNKRRIPTERLLRTFGLMDHVWDIVTRDRMPAGEETKVEMYQSLMERWRLDPDRTLVIGDMPADLQAATECGLRGAAALYGYSNPADFAYCPHEVQLHNASELIAFIETPARTSPSVLMNG